MLKKYFVATIIVLSLAIWGALNDILYEHKQNIICDTIIHAFSHH